MKLAAIVLVLALAACASSTIDTSWPDPQQQERPTPVRTAGRDILIDRDNDDIANAVEQCLRYGRVPSSGACVPPTERAARDGNTRGGWRDY